jgi:hypothetical protein
VRSDVIERVLNHIETKKVARIYQRQELLAERAQATGMLGERLELLQRGDSLNVVPISLRSRELVQHRTNSQEASRYFSAGTSTSL